MTLRCSNPGRVRKHIAILLLITTAYMCSCVFTVCDNTNEANNIEKYCVRVVCCRCHINATLHIRPHLVASYTHERMSAYTWSDTFLLLLKSSRQNGSPSKRRKEAIFCDVRFLIGNKKKKCFQFTNVMESG